MAPYAATDNTAAVNATISRVRSLRRAERAIHCNYLAQTSAKGRNQRSKCVQDSTVITLGAFNPSPCRQRQNFPKLHISLSTTTANRLGCLLNLSRTRVLHSLAIMASPTLLHFLAASAGCSNFPSDFKTSKFLQPPGRNLEAHR